MLAVHIENRRVEVRNIGRPPRPEGFALIRLLTGGICNTDLELRRGYYGFRGIPGHEFVGEVASAGDSKLIGKRVVGEINLACGKCDWCGRGLGRHCPSRTVGDGKLGLLVAQVLNAGGMKVHLYGHHRDNLRIAEGVGVMTAVTGKYVPAAAYGWVVEATGSQNGLKQAVEMTRPRGTVFMKSTVHGSIRLDTAPVIVNEITLVGSRCGRFEPALNLLQSGKINVRGMISESMALARAPRAFARAGQRGVLKVLLTGD
jgi:threonine dehydrogenase-like Zn-dependent dehydrogenase